MTWRTGAILSDTGAELGVGLVQVTSFERHDTQDPPREWPVYPRSHTTDSLLKSRCHSRTSRVRLVVRRGFQADESQTSVNNRPRECGGVLRAYEPLDESPQKLGKEVYNSLAAGNPDA